MTEQQDSKDAPAPLNQPLTMADVEKLNQKPRSNWLHKFGSLIRLISIVAAILLFINPVNVIALVRLDLAQLWIIILPFFGVIAGGYLRRNNRPPEHVKLKLENPELHTKKKYRNFFVLLTVLNLATIVFPTLLMLAVMNSPASIIGIALIPLYMVGAVLLPVNIISITRYLIKYKPSMKWMVSGLMVVLISLGLLIPGFFIVKNNFTFYRNTSSELEKFRDERAERETALATYDDSSGASQQSHTKQNALKLLEDCKVDYFIGHTGDINKAKDKSTKLWLERAEESASGIEISDQVKNTYIFASKEQTSKMTDQVRGIREDCYDKKKLFVIIDEWVEAEYPKGVWTKLKY